MIEIWKYSVGDVLRITAVNDEMFEGGVECVTDVEERSDLEKQEDGVGLVTRDGRHIEFYTSDIKSIERIARREEKPAAKAAV